MYPNSEILMQGVFYYANEVPTDIRIFKHNMKFGTGDYFDEKEIQHDLKGEFYYIEYGSTSERGKFVALSNHFLTLEDAINHAEKSVNAKINWIG